MISEQVFRDCLALLADNYGDNYPVFTNEEITDIWFDFFSKEYQGDWKLRQVFKHYLAESMYFPKSPREIVKVWKDSGQEKPPGENFIENREHFNALPSVESKDREREAKELENMTPEQMVENRKKIPLIFAIASSYKNLQGSERDEMITKLRNYSADELKMMLDNCVKSEKLKRLPTVDYSGNMRSPKEAYFEDMRKYFHSGSDKYRQMAIDWVEQNKDQGYYLVRRNGKVVDIAEHEF